MNRIVSYLLAIGLVAAATLLRAVLQPFAGSAYPWATYFLALTIAAIYLGRGPALLVLVGGALMGWGWVLGLGSSGRVFELTAHNAWGLAIYLVVGLSMVIMASRLRNAQRSAAQQVTVLRERQQVFERESSERQRAENEIERLSLEGKLKLEEFQFLFEESPVGIAFARDVECRDVWINHAFYDILRLPVGTKISFAHDHPPVLRVARNGVELQYQDLPIVRCIQAGARIIGEEYDVIGADDTVSSVLVSVAPLYDGPKVRGCIATIVDITERKRAEARERARAHELETIMAVVPAAVFIAEDPEARVVRTNRYGEQMLRLSKDAGADIGMPNKFRIFENGVEVPRERLPVQLAARGEEVKNVEEEIVFDDGSVTHWAGNAITLRGADGKPRGAVAAFVDITERKRAEASVREREELYRGLAEGMPHMVWETDARGVNYYQNKVWYDYIGEGPGSSFGEDWVKYYHPDDQAHLKAEWTKALTSNGSYAYDIEARVRRHDGVYRWFRITGVPVRNEAGEIVKWTGTCTDIDEQKRAQESYKDAERRKDEFLATLGHELRNPLAPMRNAIEIIRKNLNDERRRQWAIEIIDRQLSQLSRIIDDLLELARIASGRIALKMEDVALRDVLARAVEIARPRIEAKGHRLRVELPPNDVTFSADAMRLVQVLTNLLSNAAKHTPREGTIMVAAFLRDGMLEVRVRDTGEGIDPKVLPRMFDLFRRAAAPSNADSVLGVGLAFAKRIVELHGGHISASSEGPGKGSEFRIVLPARVGSAHDAPSAATKTPRSGTALHKRILVVDDNRDAADSMAELLKMQGHDVTCLYDGADVVAASIGFQPDVVLLDIELPNVDGYEIARRVRAEPKLRSVPLVALTGRGQENDKQSAYDAGFDFHFTKPINPNDLAELLRSL